MARDYAARCPVSPVRNTWLLAAAILLLAAQGKNKNQPSGVVTEARSALLHFRHRAPGVRAVSSRASRASPACVTVTSSALAAVGWTVRPELKVYCRGTFPDLCVRCRCAMILRGVALLVCGFCPNSSQLQTAGDC